MATQQLGRSWDVQVLISCLAAALAVIVSLLSMFGLLEDWPWVAGNLPQITLLVLCALTLKQIVDHHQHSIGIDEVKNQVASIREQQIDELINHVQPELKDALGIYVFDILETLGRLIKKQEVELPRADLDRFTSRILEQQPKKTTLLAVSILRNHPKNGIHIDDGLDDTALMRFLSSEERTLRQIVLLPCRVADLGDAYRDALRRRVRADGVTVHAADARELKARRRRLFVVAPDQQIAWTIEGGGATGYKSVLSTDSKFVATLRAEFEELERHPRVGMLTRDHVRPRDRLR